MLKVKDLHVHYGKIHAIKGINFEVNQGEIVTLIGANGAGKTTILQTVSGILIKCLPIRFQFWEFPMYRKAGEFLRK
jgi:ABC-type branched-subunit amino acid transport system ATPase component